MEGRKNACLSEGLDHAQPRCSPATQAYCARLVLFQCSVYVCRELGHESLWEKGGRKDRVPMCGRINDRLLASVSHPCAPQVRGNHSHEMMPAKGCGHRDTTRDRRKPKAGQCRFVPSYGFLLGAISRFSGTGAMGHTGRFTCLFFFSSNRSFSKSFMHAYVVCFKCGCRSFTPPSISLFSFL